MTTRVDFYILAATGRASRVAFACRLTEKAYGLQHRVYAHTANEQDARQLDEMLWTFSQGSFVPHAVLSSDTDSRTPVIIGTAGPQDGADVLINLAESAPEFATRFERVVEIVDGDESSRQAGRERFKHYRDMGLEPTTHNIN